MINFSDLLMPKKNLHAVLFPGKIDTSERPLTEIVPDWIDPDYCLKLSGPVSQPAARIAPNRIDPCGKLVFGVTKEGIYEFIGSTSSLDIYTDMADYVYSPPKPEVHTYTQAVSHQTNPAPYTFEANPVNISKGQRSVAYMRFADDRAVPELTPGSDVTEDQDRVPEEVTRALAKLFEEKPVWRRSGIESRLAADYNIKMPSWRLGAVVRRHGYFCVDGPWRSTYVRFGYDPRNDPEARRWQMIDLRLPASGGPFGERGRSQLYQLCDIEDPVVRHIIENADVLDKPHSQSGWISLDDLHSIRNQLKLKSVESLRRTGPV